MKEKYKTDHVFSVEKDGEGWPMIDHYVVNEVKEYGSLVCSKVGGLKFDKESHADDFAAALNWGYKMRQS